MAGTGELVGAQYPHGVALLSADPRHLADAMLGATKHTIGFGDYLRAHDLGHEVTVIAYEHILVGAVRAAKDWHAGSESPAAHAETDLILRASVDLAGRLAVRMAAFQGAESTPQRWETMLHEIVAREDRGPSDERPIGPSGLLVAQRVRLNIGLFRANLLSGAGEAPAAEREAA